MTQQEAAERLASDKCAGIYGYMHGTPWILVDGEWVLDSMMQMSKAHLRVTAPGVVFNWSWPWCDNPVYAYDDYGRTWGFTLDEIAPPDDPPGEEATEGDSE